MKVYAAMWFNIKTEPSCLNRSKNLCNLSILSRYLQLDLKLIIDLSVELTEPPVIKALTGREILNFMQEKRIDLGKTIPILSGFPCHTQAVERGMKTVIEVSLGICGETTTDGVEVILERA
nr:unnamed protein product [Callosobruchus analis]